VISGVSFRTDFTPGSTLTTSPLDLKPWCQSKWEIASIRAAINIVHNEFRKFLHRFASDKQVADTVIAYWGDSFSEEIERRQRKMLEFARDGDRERLDTILNNKYFMSDLDPSYRLKGFSILTHAAKGKHLALIDYLLDLDRNGVITIRRTSNNLYFIPGGGTFAYRFCNILKISNFKHGWYSFTELREYVHAWLCDVSYYSGTVRDNPYIRSALRSPKKKLQAHGVPTSQLDARCALRCPERPAMLRRGVCAVT